MGCCLASRYENGIEDSRWPTVIAPVTLIFFSVPVRSCASAPVALGQGGPSGTSPPVLSRLFVARVAVAQIDVRQIVLLGCRADFGLVLGFPQQRECGLDHVGSALERMFLAVRVDEFQRLRRQGDRELLGRHGYIAP